MHSFLWLIIGSLLFSSISCGESKKEEPQIVVNQNDNFTGTWITSTASQVLFSLDSIKAAVALCDSFGIHNIFVSVWDQGKTIYPSSVMKNLFGVSQDPRFVGRDPLAEIIEEAHKKNIKVYAWFEYGFSCSYSQNGGLIIQDKPSWAAKDQNGNLVTVNGFDWMNAFMPDVQQFMINLVSEVVKNYNVDGIQEDDRMPALPTIGGYDNYTVNLYKEQHNGMAPPVNYQDTAWINWRAGLLTSFQATLYKSVKAINPSLIVCCAPSIYPWGLNNYLQDWPSWLNRGYVDLIIPQIYRYDISSYKSTLAQQVSYLNTTTKSKFYPGILIQNGTYNPTENLLKQMIEADRGYGFTGEAFWFYEGLKKFPALFTNYKKGGL